MATQLLSAEIQKPTSPNSDFKSSAIHPLNIESIMELIDYFKNSQNKSEGNFQEGRE